MNMYILSFFVLFAYSWLLFGAISVTTKIAMHESGNDHTIGSTMLSGKEGKRQSHPNSKLQIPNDADSFS